MLKQHLSKVSTACVCLLESHGAEDSMATNGGAAVCRSCCVVLVVQAVLLVLELLHDFLYNCTWPRGIQHQMVFCAALCCAVLPAGDYAQALNMYNIALQHAPDSTRVLVNASLTLLKLAKPRAAHEKATLAVGLQPRNAKAYHARHKAKEVLGDFKVCAEGRGFESPLSLVNWV